MSIKQGDRWAICYRDGSVFTSGDGTPWDAPRRDVIGLLSCKDQTECDVYSLQQEEAYYYEPDRGGWNEVANDFTFYDHLQRARHPLILWGGMMADSDWKAAWDRIVKYRETNWRWLTGQSDDRPPSTY